MRLPGILLLAALLAPARAGALGTADPFDIRRARAVFESKCSLCHPLQRPLSKRKERRGWEHTVARMQRYAAGRITDEDAATVVEYLVRVRSP
ncbi:MAG: hypothetical protein Kow0092_39010 [Deferrisomatales bacterium]